MLSDYRKHVDRAQGAGHTAIGFNSRADCCTDRIIKAAPGW